MTEPSDSKLKTLATYASWTLGAQVAAALLQFGYAAVTSRLVTGAGFGAYAIALSLATVVSLIAQGGLGQAASRTPELHPGKLSFLVLFSAGLGVVSGLVLLIVAHPWAALWGAPEAAAPTRLVGVIALFAPLSGLVLGVLRRLGEFRALAVSTIFSSAAGIGVGVVAVVIAPGPVTLLVAPIVATVLLTTAALVLTRRHWWARPKAAAAWTDLGFAWRVLGLTMLSYLSGTVPKWSVSRWVGADALGQWNRADILTAVPIEQVITAFGHAVYPEFRHDIGVQSRTKQAWTDYLILIAWACFPVAAVLAGLAPLATALLFGPGWGVAAAIAPFVAIQYAFVAVETALMKALESVGRFRILAPTALASLAVIVLGTIGTYWSRSWLVALVALILASLVRHLLQIIYCVRLGALDGCSLAKGYSSSAIASGVFGGAAALVSTGLAGGLRPAPAICGALIFVSTAVAAFVLRRHLPPLRILARYRSKGSSTN